MQISAPVSDVQVINTINDLQDWSVAQFVQEFCRMEGSRRLRIDSINLPNNLKQLCYHEVDGKQLLPEIKDHQYQDLFFQALGIHKFAQETFLLNAPKKLRPKSQQLNGNPQSGKRKHCNANGKAGGTNATVETRQKIQPQPVVAGVSTNTCKQGRLLATYLSDSVLWRVQSSPSQYN